MKKKHRRMLHILSWMGFIIYLFMMVYFLFFSEQLGRTPSRTYHYNLVPLAEIKRYLNYIDTIGFLYVMLNLAGNVICFMPLGFVLPILSNHRWGFFRITLISALASLCVELVQLVSKLGSCDVDDIILNICGGMIGYAGFCICKKAYHIYAKHRKKQHKKGKEGFYEQKEKK